MNNKGIEIPTTSSVHLKIKLTNLLRRTQASKDSFAVFNGLLPIQKYQ